MMTKKIMATLVLAVFSSVTVANRATAQETTKDSKKADKAKKAEEQPPAQTADEGKRKDHADQEKGKDKCKGPKYESREIEKKTKWGYVCSEADTCDKACNLWRKDKETNDAEFVAKQGEWAEATDGQRRRYGYFCKCEDAK